MITVSCCFVHGFKIMHIPQDIIPLCAPPQPVTVICSVRGDEIEVPYICCIDGRVPEFYELWALAEDGVREVHPYDRVRLLSLFREDTFHTHFFNSRRFQIPFLGRRAVNESVEFINVVRTTQHVQSRVDYIPNIFAHSWGINPTDMFPPNASTITRNAYNPIVTYHGFVLRSNHKRLRLKRIELKRFRVKEYLARVSQDICDEVATNVRAPVNNALGDALSNDSDSNDGWLDIYDSD